VIQFVSKRVFYHLLGTNAQRRELMPGWEGPNDVRTVTRVIFQDLWIKSADYRALRRDNIRSINYYFFNREDSFASACREYAIQAPLALYDAMDMYEWIVERGLLHNIKNNIL